MLLNRLNEKSQLKFSGVFQTNVDGKCLFEQHT